MPPPENDNERSIGKSEIRSELNEDTRLPLKLVLSIVGGAVSLVLVYGTLKMDVFAVGNRVDSVEERLARIERTNCAIAAKLGILSSDCGSSGGGP